MLIHLILKIPERTEEQDKITTEAIRDGISKRFYYDFGITPGSIAFHKVEIILTPEEL